MTRQNTESRKKIRADIIIVANDLEYTLQNELVFTCPANWTEEKILYVANEIASGTHVYNADILTNVEIVFGNKPIRIVAEITQND